MVEVSFGEWLKRQRRALGLTQEQLARQIGCAAVTVRKIEGEERRPSAQILERLADVFGITPGERTALLRYARGDWTQQPEQKAGRAPWRPEPAPRSNLPAAVTSLIAREQEITRVRGYLGDPSIRLVTLIGPPGVGKTRLGLEAARTALPDFPGGVFFVALAPLDDETLIAPTIAQALGHVEAKTPHTPQQLAEGIADKPMLLALDNCEHLVESIASLTSGLLSSCPRLKILATSRESLRVAGEWVFTVQGLDTPCRDTPVSLETAGQSPAVRLFVERACAVHADFELAADNCQAVAAICAQLDGLPLAIELMAARMRLMRPKALLERLNEAFVLSADGMRAASARQKTLGNAIGWSYHSLPPEEQALFGRLAVFSGGFTLEAAEATCRPRPEGRPTADLVASLLDKSLLQRVSGAAGGQRFAMLVTIQQFALEALRRSGEEAEARNRHLTYCVDLAETGDAEMRGAHQVEWIERVEADHDNFRAALDWSIAQQNTVAALRLLCALGWPWEVRGHYSEALCWLDRIRALPGVTDYPLVYARLLNHLGRYCWTQGLVREGRAFLEESQALSLNLGVAGERNLAETLNWLGLVSALSEGNGAGAQALVENGLELFRRCGDERGMALSTFHLGIVESVLDHNGRAQHLYEQSLARFRQFGDLFFVARVSDFLGDLHLKQGQPDAAQALYEQRLGGDQRLLFWEGIIEGWCDLGHIYRLRGEAERASQYYEESVRVCGEHASVKPEPYYHAGLMALHLGNDDLARQRFIRLLEYVRGVEDKSAAGLYLEGMAAAGGTHPPERVAKLLGAAQAQLVANRRVGSPEIGLKIDYLCQSARDQLGPARFEALHAAGQALSFEQALAYALEQGRG